MSSQTVVLYPAFDPELVSGDEPELLAPASSRQQPGLPDQSGLGATLLPTVSLNEWRLARGLPPLPRKNRTFDA